MKDRRCYGVPFPVMAWCIAAGCGMFAAAQVLPVPPGTTPTTTPKTLLAIAALPPQARIYAAALGSRLTTKGMEQTTFTGTLVQKSGSSPVTIVWQSPGLVRLILPGAGATLLTFDGSNSGVSGASAITGVNADLLETFTDDYPDVFFFRVAAGSSYRFLGARFRNDGGKTAGYTGPYYDICQKVAPVPANTIVSQKLYMFDSGTGLLSKVRYVRGTGSHAVPIEVQYSNWQSTNGQKLPGTITRLVSGTNEFTIHLGASLLAPAATSISEFQIP